MLHQDSEWPSISADGRFVAFSSLADHLVAGDTNGFWDVVVRDMQTGTNELVSITSAGVQGNGGSGSPSISADGRYVAFESGASNLAGMYNPGEIFIHDRQTGTTQIVSVGSGGAQGNSPSSYPSISANGLYVVFMSSSSNLVPGDSNMVFDTFLRDIVNGTTERVSVDANEVQANSASYQGAVSSDDTTWLSRV